MQTELIQNRIHEIRGVKVMLDFDLGELYEVETRVLNQAVKRNKDRFPEDFIFQLTTKEWRQMSSQIVMSSEMRSQNATASEVSGPMRSQIVTASDDSNAMRSQIVIASLKKRNKSAAPYAFTEHGVTMLASILKSERSVQMNIAIVRAFITLRQFAINYEKFSKEIKELQQITGSHNIQLSQIYDALKNLMNEKANQKNWKERARIGFKPNKGE